MKQIFHLSGAPKCPAKIVKKYFSTTDALSPSCFFRFSLLPLTRTSQPLNSGRHQLATRSPVRRLPTNLKDFTEISLRCSSVTNDRQTELIRPLKLTVNSPKQKHRMSANAASPSTILLSLTKTYFTDRHTGCASAQAAKAKLKRSLTKNQWGNLNKSAPVTFYMRRNKYSFILETYFIL